jgi:hypothetical protein
MTWVNALREYAKQTGKFSVPKRGTPEYDAVKKIQDSMAAPAPEVKAAAVAKVTAEVKARKVKAAKPAMSEEEIAAKHAADKAAAKAAADQAKADAAVAKAAAKADKELRIKQAEDKAAAEAAAPKPKVKRSAPPAKTNVVHKRKAAAPPTVTPDAVVSFA